MSPIHASAPSRTIRFRLATIKVLLLALPFMVWCANPSFAESPSPKYVFMFIGDGMSFEQVRLASLALKEQGKPQLRMTCLPVNGQLYTRSANNAVTDSAAAATALASGVKTDNGTIGQLPDGTPVAPISVKLLQEGRLIGVLTSVTANHATPAGYYAHVQSRRQYEEIGLQLPGSGIHFLAGRWNLTER